MDSKDSSEEQPTTDFVPVMAPEALAARYEILAELGRGGMGIVYKARDRETGAIVALKVLHPAVANRPDLIERFKAELLLARKITHKNVCRVYDLNRFGDVAVISMEYIEGESLRSLLKREQGLSIRYGLKLLGQIIAGLGEAHTQGVVHRDLKPENVLIARDGTVKVMDFGIARSLEAGAATMGGLIGTPAYMSPEQAEGKPADARSDLYSLGLVIYEMFTGQQVFKGDTAVALAMKQVSETPPPPRQFEPDLSERIDRAILKCLEKNPAKRFQSVEQLETALTEQPEAKPMPAQGEAAEVPLPLHLTRWQPSDWLLVFLAIAGLALFFPFFERTSLAPRSKVSFDRSVLRRIAQEYAQRLGAPVGKESETNVDSFENQYDSVAQRAGARAALELANNPVPYWKWRVNWENGTRISVDNRGSLLSFTRDFPADLAMERLPMEEARPLAEKALREFFNRDASLLLLEAAAGDTWRGHAATSFTWADRNDYQGLKRRYVVRLVGREVANIDSRFDLPSGYVFPINLALQLLPAIALVLVMAMLGFSQRLQVDLGARWRIVLLAVEFVVGGWFGWFWFFRSTETSLKIVVSLFMGVANAVLVFFASVPMERSVCRIAPARLSTFVRLFNRRAASEPCGLAILRGTFLGLALLGADNFLVWLGTSRLGTRLDIVTHIYWQAGPFLSNPWPSAHIVLSALHYAVAIMVILVFPASFVARFVPRPSTAGLLAAAVAAACLVIPAGNSMGAVQPYHWKLLLLLFDCLVLVWTFHRFDVLTVSWAMFAFAFCWQNYFLLVMFEPTGAVEQWVAFAVWGLFVVAAGAVAFQSALQGAYRRAAAAFE